MRQFIKASNKTLKEVFEEIDQSGQGVVTNLEFKEGIRKLLIGITSREIDDLINVVDMNKDGRVDWLEFCAKFR
jgi:Ca2+-binding EF-hand superfamily protein